MSFLLKEDGDFLLQENGDKIILDEIGSNTGTAALSFAPLQIAGVGQVSSVHRVSQQVAELANAGTARQRISQHAAEAANTGTSIQRISAQTAEAANTGTSRQRISQFLCEIIYRNTYERSHVFFLPRGLMAACGDPN